MIAVGIDPGLSGGISAVAFSLSAPPRLVDVIDVPVYGENAKRRVHVRSVLGFLEKHSPDVAFIERAQAMPDQGSSSGFIYGRAVGALEASIEGWGLVPKIVEPSVWKRKLGLIGQDKEASRQLALSVFPDADRWIGRKKDHNRAESVLIAIYGIRYLLPAG